MPDSCTPMKPGNIQGKPDSCIIEMKFVKKPFYYYTCQYENRKVFLLYKELKINYIEYQRNRAVGQ
jgi:hypothetical protein